MLALREFSPHRQPFFGERVELTRQHKCEDHSTLLSNSIKRGAAFDALAPQILDYGLYNEAIYSNDVY